MNRTAVIGMICSAAMMLSGCVVSNSVDSLLSPPEISEDQREIYAALKKAAGENIVLQYPKNGAYRSAFVVENIDGDAENEAVTFYLSAADGKNDGSLRINILDNIGGQWYSVSDFAGAGAGIDRVIVSELGNSGRKNVIIGFTSSSGDKNFRSYVYSGDSLVNTFADSYASMFVTDLDNDGAQELSVIHSNNAYTDTKAYYSLVSDDGENVYVSSTVNLNDRTTEFLNIAVGRVGSDTPAVFIDGLDGATAATEIIYCINGVLRNPLYLSESETIRKTRRSSEYLSMDIDLDGIVEIPTQNYFPGYDQNSREPFFITSWNIMDSFEIVKKYSGYFNLNDGYCFILPSRWENVVTMKSDPVKGDIIFLRYEGELISSTKELMRLTAVPQAECGRRLSEGYQLIKTKDNICYMYKVPSETGEPLVLTESEINNNFRIING
ncbi:MAG: hypothetical protein IJZ72_01135 [Oscillospiraceae bacterium]|nr:hypothetical protein [Oscillospiraceae bacterium]